MFYLFDELGRRDRIFAFYFSYFGFRKSIFTTYYELIMRESKNYRQNDKIFRVQ